MTLEELLASRDRRRDMQARLMEAWPHGTLVVLTVVMPGPQKQTRSAAIVAEAAVQALDQAFAGRVHTRTLRDLRTGFEAYYMVQATADQAKRQAVAIEEKHALGRLMDIDVIGAGCVPYSRAGLQSPPRTCLVCGRPARECMRSAAHPLDQLMNRIDELCDGYLLRLH